MAKKRSSKKQIFAFKKESIIWILLIVLIVTQGISAWYIVKLDGYAHAESNLSMRFLLKDVEEGRYKYPVIDVTENRVYIPEARISLPLNEVSREIRYNYSGYGMGNSFKTIYFSVSSIVGRQTDAKYATCDVMATLARPSMTQGTDNKRVGTIEPTKDGLSYIYMHSGGTCWDQESYSSLTKSLVEVVKAAKNY